MQAQRSEAVREALVAVAGELRAVDCLRRIAIFDLIEDKAAITSDDQLFEALMDVMYATRPKGVT